MNVDPGGMSNTTNIFSPADTRLWFRKWDRRSPCKTFAYTRGLFNIAGRTKVFPGKHHKTCFFAYLTEIMTQRSKSRTSISEFIEVTDQQPFGINQTRFEDIFIYYMLTMLTRIC